MKLYDLSQNYANLLAMIESGELDADAVTDTLESIEDAITEKADGIYKLMRQLEHEADGFKAEEKRLAERRKSIEAHHARLKQYVETQLTAVGLDKLKVSVGSFAFANNPPAVSITDESLIPILFKKPQPDIIDKAAIKVMLQTGAEVPGAELTQGKSLRMR